MYKFDKTSILTSAELPKHNIMLKQMWFKLQATEAKQQRDEALNHVQLLTDKLEQFSNGQNGSIGMPKDLRGLSIQKLKNLQVR